MSSADTTLSSYVPFVVARTLAASPAPLPIPAAERFSAAILMADISGFTALAERLAERGPGGAEELTALLNNYFGQLIDLISAHGGDVFKFAGDALLAVWPSVAEDLPTVTRRAAQCALATQSILHGLDVGAGERLSLRIGVGAGEVRMMIVGGVGGRCEVLVAGPPLLECGAARSEGQPGEVMLTRSAWALVRDHCLGRLLPDGVMRLDALLKPDPLRPAEPVALHRQAEAALSAFIPEAVLSRLAAGQTAWLAELRRVSVLFLNIEGIDYNGPNLLQVTQTVLVALQESLAHHRGTIRQFLVDDKGTVLIAAFGLPPRAQEDDAIRAVQAAQTMQARLAQLGLRGATGITTGRAFCGPVGNALRREYAMVGDVVNLAARLMEAAGNVILCDEATYTAARGRVAFDALPAISVKGKAEPVALYRPRGQARIPVRTQPIIGRVSEREWLLRGVQGVARGSGGGVLVIEGEAGIGKSRLVDEARRWAEAVSVRALLGAGDTGERETPYHAFRPILSRLFRLENVSGEEERGERLLAALANATDLLPGVALLNDLLPVKLDENAITSGLSPERRRAALRELLLRILLGSAARTPTILIMEDAQALDPASWGLLLALLQRQTPGARAPLLIVATRPLAEPPAEYTRLLSSPATRQLLLGPLPPSETLLLVCRRLGVAALPEQMSALILERARGNPFFSEELAYALRDNGLIVVEGGECRIAPGVGDLREVTLPDTVQRAIVSRIDLLPPRLQLTLKVASVIGRTFPLRTLREVHPIPADRERLHADLLLLQRLDLTALHTSEPELTYMFRDESTREVAYSLLLFAQRRELHREVAQWFERTYRDPASHYGTLAHHWQAAGETATALDYLDRASDYALRRYANDEAADHLRRALDLDANQPGPPLRRVAWARQLGEAYYRLDRLSESRTHYEAALDLLKQPAPHPDGRGEMAGVFGQALRQARNRARRSERPTVDNPPIPGLEDAFAAYERLAQIHYRNHDLMAGLHAALRALNLAESAQAPAELARGYAGAGLAAGLLGWHKLAEDYAAEAQRRAAKLAPQTQASVLLSSGAYWTGIGRWQPAHAALSKAAEIAKNAGERLLWEESSAQLADLAYYQGQFEEAALLRASIGASWQTPNLLPALLALDRLDDKTLAQAEALAAAGGGPLELYGNLALALLRRGEPQLARGAATTAATQIALARPTTHGALPAYAGVAETFLALLEAQRYRSNEDREIVEQAARQSCDDLATFARTFPIARPRALLYSGLLLWLTGHHRAASRRWFRAVLAARDLHMPYDEALAHYELARHLAPRDRLRQDQMALAYTGFSKLGAAYDLERMKDS